MKKHEDAAQDRAMMKKMAGKSKVAKHLKKDVKEAKKGIKEDKSLMKKLYK